MPQKISAAKFNIDVESLISLPGRVNIYWKDLKGCYLGCNDLSAEKAGLSSRKEVLGTSDEDIPYDVAHVAIEQDKQVITCQMEMLFFNTAVYDNNVSVDYFTVKTPLLDSQNGKIAGVLGMSYYLAEYPLENNLVSWGTLAEKGITFSKRQVECLYYLVNGLPCKQIAKIIDLSPRTVERYIDLTKRKLHCNTQSQLIEKALKLNFIKESLLFGKLTYPVTIKKSSK